MKWSVKIGKFVGIDVYMHLTFLLLIGWVALLHWQRGQSVGAALVGVLFILAIFLCVVLHEFGHALMARRYGIATRDIILLPIGGVARLEKIPSQPMQEFWVALAGPAVNVVIAAALFVWLQATASWEPLRGLTVTTGPLLERLMAVNLFMIAFNMIPAFPMDGGRVFAGRPGNTVELRPGDSDCRFHRPFDCHFVWPDGPVLQSVSAVHRGVRLVWRNPGSGVDPNEGRCRRHPGSPGNGQRI